MNKYTLTLLFSFFTLSNINLNAANETSGQRSSLLTHRARCEECPGVVFYNPEAAAFHMALHTGEATESYCKCGCNQTFQSEFELDLHLCALRFLNTFTCEICKEPFRNKATCTEHQEEHFCRYCQPHIWFATIQEARAHEVAEHGGHGQRRRYKRGLLSSNMREAFDKDIEKEESHRDKRRR